ncbi:MarR family winged helix-turn-helix transcriptional regulator [Acuticoccus mangrovi]|uniref:MarR family transcriptional regulator n=1 Tax=Acuticoccus mangrovi TaxID=2796142 RepID=A0A934ILY4_9HYPH|nr:MarR family transcriptional regulator [Acuticoccus mangrovi]MBJ3777361.1 MarR family transcriptional regulator [Acuticoccus mangrovi]
MTKDMTPLLGYRLKLAQHALHRRMEEALRPLGLSPAQYAVLAELNARPDQTNADLAERAFITPQSMQGVLTKLEGSGLVERRQDARHGRRQLARLTGEGRLKAEAANAAVMRVEDLLEAAVHPACVQDAVDLMNRLHNAMCE